MSDLDLEAVDQRYADALVAKVTHGNGYPAYWACMDDVPQLVAERDLAYSVLRKLEAVRVESMSSIPWAWALVDTTMTDDELALVERLAGSTTPVPQADQ